eukprot:COSAG05_NODE_16557_length_343_cov_1.008197_1_plen_31_part_10
MALRTLSKDLMLTNWVVTCRSMRCGVVLMRS